MGKGKIKIKGEGRKRNGKVLSAKIKDLLNRRRVYYSYMALNEDRSDGSITRSLRVAEMCAIECKMRLKIVEISSILF